MVTASHQGQILWKVFLNLCVFFGIGMCWCPCRERQRGLNWGCLHAAVCSLALVRSYGAVSPAASRASVAESAQLSPPCLGPLQCLPLVTAVAASHHHPSPRRIQGRGEEHCNEPPYSHLVPGNTERFSGRRWGQKAVVCQDLHEPEIVPLGHDLWNSGIMGLLLIFPIEGLCFQFSYQITKGKLQMVYWNGYWLCSFSIKNMCQHSLPCSPITSM